MDHLEDDAEQIPVEQDSEDLSSVEWNVRSLVILVPNSGSIECKR